MISTTYTKIQTKPSIAVLTLGTIMLSAIAFFPLVSQHEVLAQQNQQQMQEPGSVLKLSQASISIDIPLSKGYI